MKTDTSIERTWSDVKATCFFFCFVTCSLYFKNSHKQQDAIFYIWAPECVRRLFFGFYPRVMYINVYLIVFVFNCGTSNRYQILNSYTWPTWYWTSRRPQSEVSAQTEWVSPKICIQLRKTCLDCSEFHFYYLWLHHVFV